MKIINVLRMWRFSYVYAAVLIFFSISGCKTMDSDFKETFNIGGAKEVVINVRQQPELKNNEKENKQQPVSAKTKSGSDSIAFNIVADERFIIAPDLNIIKEFIPKAYVAIIRIIDYGLWLYLEENRKFYDSGWYVYDKLSDNVIKAIRTYFDIDLLQEYSPKYNKKEYFYFKKIDFDKIRLFNFGKPVHTWLYETFKTEIGDTNILCISYDEAAGEIWFAKKNTLKKFNIKREIWSNPLGERTGEDLLHNSEISEIISLKDYLLIITFNCNLLYYDRVRDIWKEWKPANQDKCNYISYVDDDNDYIWFKSDIGIWRFDKKNIQWYEFDAANFLSGKEIKKVLLDDNKNFWIETQEEIAYYDRGLYSWEIHKKSAFPAKNRNGENYLNSIYAIGKENDTVWLSTETGLLNYNLRSKLWTIFDKKDFNDKFKSDILYFTSIHIDEKFIWLGTDSGLFRISKQSLTQ